ncbi:MAG TPA: DUF3857 domain-containing protein [Chryseosolibacter sp.]
MRIFTILVLYTVFSSAIAQQSKPIQFGTVTSSEMKMSLYEKDTTAPAVILHDEGYFNGNRFEFTRHVRIKILTEAGTSFGNFTIRVPSKSYMDGYTFNMENGLLRKTKLERSNIYNEEIVDGFDVYKVFFPAVKPGSVIDFRYTHMGLPFEWRFQEVIPVVYNHLTLESTSNVYYKKVFYGLEKITEVKDNEFVAENMPAIKVEPLMNHYSNYVTRFQFDVETVSFPRWNFYRDFSTKWEKVGKRLMEHEFFGGVINGCAFLNEKAREIEQGKAAIPEKISAAVDYIRQNIKWNNNFGVIAPKSFREDFKTNHSGNSATINLLLITLLKKSGVKVYPLVLSTRDNGMINPLSASLNKLNYVVAFVKDGDRSILVDATNAHTVPGILPEHCLNTVGWAIEEGESGELIDLTPGRANMLKRFIMIKPNESNELIAEVTSTYGDYAYLDWIAEFEKNGSEKSYGDVLKTKHPDAQIDSYAVVSQDTANLKASERAVLSLSGTPSLESIGDREFSLNPFVFNDFVNPFRSTGRAFPIDFIYPRKRSVIVSIELPPGYELKSCPQSSRIDYPGGKAAFIFLSSVANNRVSIRCDFTVRQTLFTEDEYETMKAFFTGVINKLNESVQIVNKT